MTGHQHIPPAHVLARLDQRHAEVNGQVTDVVRLIRLHAGTGCDRPGCYGPAVAVQLQSMSAVDRTHLLVIALTELAKTSYAQQEGPST